MTASTTRGTEQTVDQIITSAYQTAGVLGIDETATDNQLAFGRRQLDILIDSLMIEGVFARQVVLENTTLTANDYTYSMSSYVINIIGDGMYIDADETDVTKASGETVVKQIDRETWHRISAKSATGRPSLFFYDRSIGTAGEVKLWPMPDEAGTIRFQIYKWASDTYEGSATLELRQYWSSALIWELAHIIATASSLPVDRCSYLNKRAERLVQRARGFANQRLGTEVHIVHSTPWTGGSYR